MLARAAAHRRLELRGRSCAATPGLPEGHCNLLQPIRPKPLFAIWRDALALQKHEGQPKRARLDGFLRLPPQGFLRRIFRRGLHGGMCSYCVEPGSPTSTPPARVTARSAECTGCKAHIRCMQARTHQ